MVAMENGTSQMAGALVPAGPVKSVQPKKLAGIKQVDTQTLAIGLITPPPDIRAIVDKTAQFVAKNGASHTLTPGFQHNLCSPCRLLWERS